MGETVLDGMATRGGSGAGDAGRGCPAVNADDREAAGAGGPGGREPTRRRFLHVTGAAGSAALATAGMAGAAPAAAGAAAPLSDRERALVLQVARVGARYPVEFPGLGEPGPASARATGARLSRQLPELSAARLALVREGAGTLIADGLLDATPDRLLDGIGSRVAAAGTRPPAALVAVAALAAATVARRLDPHADHPARLWLDIVRHRHLRQTRRAARDPRTPRD
jgi:hypothetical protein